MIDKDSLLYQVLQRLDISTGKSVAKLTIEIFPDKNPFVGDYYKRIYGALKTATRHGFASKEKSKYYLTDEGQNTLNY